MHMIENSRKDKKNYVKLFKLESLELNSRKSSKSKQEDDTEMKKLPFIKL